MKDQRQDYEQPKKHRLRKKLDNPQTPQVADDSYTMGEFFNDRRAHQRERKAWHQDNTVPIDKTVLVELGLEHHVEGDGAGGEKFVIKVNSDYGPKIVDWWVSTGLWKVRNSKAEGYGLRRMVSYFRLRP